MQAPQKANRHARGDREGTCSSILTKSGRSTTRQVSIYTDMQDPSVLITKELNPQYFLQVCRQLQFEVAESYQEMMNLKCSMHSNANPPNLKQQVSCFVYKGFLHIQNIWYCWTLPIYYLSFYFIEYSMHVHLFRFYFRRPKSTSLACKGSCGLIDSWTRCEI